MAACRDLRSAERSADINVMTLMTVRGQARPHQPGEATSQCRKHMALQQLRRIAFAIISVPLLHLTPPPTCGVCFYRSAYVSGCTSIDR